MQRRRKSIGCHRTLLQPSTLQTVEIPTGNQVPHYVHLAFDIQFVQDMLLIEGQNWNEKLCPRTTKHHLGTAQMEH